MWAIDSAINAVAAGFQVYSHKKSLEQERDLHEHDCSLATEQHFQSLSTELLAIAKEADRDVWEQRNNQYNNMIVCATLMFTVPINNINQGAYHETDEGAKYGKEFASLFTMDGMFTIFTGVSVGSLFVCIVACFVVTRRMSSYMIERSSNLVDRLAISTALAHEISGSAQTQHGDATVERLLGSEKQEFHDRVGAAIGSGPKQGVPTSPRSEAAAGKGKIHFGVQMQPVGGRSPTVTADSSDDDDAHSYARFVDPTARYAPVEPPRPRPYVRGTTLNSGWAVRGARAATAPLNFSNFYREHCGWLDKWVTWSFVVGVLSAWISTWFLLWNQLPHILLPVVGFAILAIIALLISGGLERVAKKQDADISKALRSGMPSQGAGSSFSGARLTPSPPPSPPASPPEPPAGPAPRRTAPRRAPRASAPSSRLRELHALLNDGLVTEEEYGTKRAEIVAAL